MAEIQGAFFQECTHPHRIVVPEKRGPHAARLICRDCKKFFSWMPKPETVQRQKENAEILTALSKIDKLPPWERQFVRDLVTHRNISPRQQAKLLELRDVFLKKDSGVWGIKQEYFDKVYPKQERKPAHDSLHGETMPPD